MFKLVKVEHIETKYIRGYIFYCRYNRTRLHAVYDPDDPILKLQIYGIYHIPEEAQSHVRRMIRDAVNQHVVPCPCL